MNRRVLALTLAIGLIASMSQAAIVETTEFQTNVHFQEIVDQADIGTVTTPKIYFVFDQPNLDGTFEHQITFAWPEAVPLILSIGVQQGVRRDVPLFTTDFSATLLDSTGVVVAEAVLGRSIPNLSDTFSVTFADVVPFEMYTLAMRGLGDGRTVNYIGTIVPVPPAMFLFATALGGLLLARRRARRNL